MRQEAEAWSRQTQADLETARINHDAGRYYAATFFCQEAVEKGLKAVYIEQRGVAAPRTHHLEFLGVEVGAPPTVAADLMLLNPAFDLVRYPIPPSGAAPVDIVTPDQAVEHLAAAERVLVWIAEQLT